jgi:hypothetical protein
MPNTSNLPAGGDIGPIPDASIQGAVPTNHEGGPAIEQKSDAAALGTRKVLPDVAAPVIETAKEPAAEPANSAPPPSDKEQAGDANGDQKQTAPSEAAKESWPAIDCSKPHKEVDAAITECMKTKYGAAVVDDMEDAQILLSYLARNGLLEDRKVSDPTIQNLIEARYRMRTGVFDCEKEEAQFRKNYGIIAKAATPVTVASLRDSLPTTQQKRWVFFMEPQPRSTAERTCFRYRDVTLVVLFLLLIFQIYWTISSSVLNKIDVLISEINSANQPNTVESTPPKTTPIPNETKVEKSQPTSVVLASKKRELEANYSMLRTFMAPLLSFEDKDKSKQQKDGPAKAESPEDISSPLQTQTATIRALAGQVIDVMQKWWLPLLYGALGALVFVVRTLSLEARDRLFRREALVSLNLRVFLGMISGLAIGWFWNQSSQGAGTAGPMSVSTLSPFALAFVAGYGVELFFTLLDKIVSTFTSKS